MSAGLQLEVVRILGSGGFGTVVMVRDRRAGAHYAAKAIRPEHLRNEKIQLRMRDEAALLTRLHHPHIVHVHGMVRIAARPVVLMEWIDGAPLHEIIAATGGLGVADAAEIVAQAADALAAAWDAPDPLTGAPLRVIHRDLKPSNLLLTTDGRVKLVDFGIAKGQFEGKAAITNSMVLGTRDYVAPERLDGDADHPAGDVYAMGMVFYELLSGGKLGQSMFSEQHQQRLNRKLGRLRPEGIDEQARRVLVELIGSMCAYHASSRPSHKDVAARLARFMGRFGLRPDLERVGREIVARLAALPGADPTAHPDYLEILFLEDPRGVAPSEVDDRVRALLARPDWVRRCDEIARLIAEDPTWTAAPFAELLDRRNPPRWRFWAERLDAAALSSILELVAARADERVLRHARRLASHSDPLVRHMAERVLVRHGAT